MAAAKGIYAKLLHWLGGEEDRPAKSRKASRPSPGLDQDKDSIEDFSLGVQRLLANRHDVTAGAISVINLEHLRQALEKDNRWEQFAEKVDAIAQQTIRSRLDSVDLFLAMAGPAYMIVFGRLQPPQAALKCAILGKEIENRLIGSNPLLRDAGIRTAVARLTETDLKFETDGLAPLMDVLKLSRPVVKQEEDAPLSHLPAPVETGEDGPGQETQWYYAKGTLKPPPIEYKFLPMCHLKQRIVATYYCVPQVRIRPNEVMSGDDVLLTAPAATVVDINVQIIERGINDATKMLDDTGHAFVALPICFEAIATNVGRKRCLAACAEATPLIRRHLIIDLIGLPEGIPETRLFELTGLLQPFCRAVFIRAEVDRRRIRHYHESSVFGLGFNLDQWRHSDTVMREKMARFAAIAAEGGLKSYVLNLTSQDQFDMALDAGFDFVSMPGVLGLSDRPEAAHYLSAWTLRRLNGAAHRLSGAEDYLGQRGQ